MIALRTCDDRYVRHRMTGTTTLTMSLWVLRLPKNRIWKKRFLAAEFYFLFQRWRRPFFGNLHMCHPAKFQQNQTIVGWVITIFCILLFCAHLGPPLGHWLSELGGPTPTWLVPWGTPTIVLDTFFRFPKKSPNSKCRSSKDEWCQNLRLFAPV